MVPTWFRWLRRDARLIIDEVDKETKGKLDIKDLKKKPDSVYGQLLDELNKRHYRLCNLLILQSKKIVETKKTNLIIRCPYQNIAKQDYKTTQKIDS